MRRFRMLSLVVPLLAMLACQRPAEPQIRAVTRTPRALLIPSTPPQISTGYGHACGLKTDGTVVCWGWNDYGQATVPDGLASVEQVSAGHQHTCALKSDGTIVCWGDDSYGQVTVQVGLDSVAQVSAGYLHTCVLKTDGTVVCWGFPWHGATTVPVGLASVTQLSTGMATCALKADATLVCWGWVPGGLDSVAQMSAGTSHVCALKTNGAVVCWGDNGYGESTVPDGIGAVAQVSGGFLHTCALKTAGTVVCWGYNPYGETTVPDGLSSVAQVSAGAFYTCARRNNGTVVCWGQLTAPADLNLGVQDATAPVVTHTISSAANGSGWYASDVTVTFTATDPESAVTSSPCGTQTVSASTPIDGITVTCVATSIGGTTTADVTIKLDKVSPVVTFTGNTGSYTVDQAVAITCTTSDNLSGVESSNCALISGGAYSFAAGANTFSATATDHAGNVGSATTTFTVTVTSRGLCSLVQRWVSNTGVATSLCVKLDHGNYNAFRNELKAQTGKNVSEANAAVLLRLVNGLDPQ